MKIVLKTPGIIAIMVIIGLSMVTCSTDPCKDGHTFPAWTNPTCTVAGNSVRTCINCTETDTRTSGFAALGHQGLTPAFAATCTADGSSESGTCTRVGCGQVVTGTVIPALGHQGLTPAFAAICTLAGNSEASGTCTRAGCGQVFTGTIVPALGHQGLTPAFAATCTEAGNSQASGTCTRVGCGQVVTGTVIPALGHQGLTPAFAATCTADGSSESGTCTRAGCGQVITGTVIPALGHQGLTPAFAATCTLAGNSQISGTCTRTGCGQVVTGTVIPALGHDHTSSLICKRTGCDHQFALGDTGPAGGKIIYIAPTGFTVTSTTTAFTTYTAYYLEAAPANAVGGTGVQTTMRWSTRSSSPFLSVTGTGQGIGSGRNNTALIIAAEKAAYPSDTYIYAALACDNYSVADFNDWFLPSRDELNQLYLRRTDVGIASIWCWSSSQFGIDFAWYQSFVNGDQAGLPKSYNTIVRPVRAF